MKKTNMNFFYITLVMGFMFLCGTAQSATYYIDNVGGSDAADGISTSTPWQHCPGDPTATVNASRTLAAGDIIVFKGGVTYSFSPTVTDYIAANASGSSGSPIIYRSGHIHSTPWPDATNRAVIDGANANPTYASSNTGIISLRDYSYITIEGLEIKNQPVKDVFLGIIGAKGNTFNHLTIDGCYLHFANSNGIVFQGVFNDPPYPGNLIIKNNIIEETWRNNISFRYGFDTVLIEGNQFDKPGNDVYSVGSTTADNICFESDGSTKACQSNIIIRGNDLNSTGPFLARQHILLSSVKNMSNVLVENNYFHGTPTATSVNFSANLTNITFRNNVFHVYPTTGEGIFRFHIFAATMSVHGLNILNNTFVSKPAAMGIIYLGMGSNHDASIFFNVDIRNNIIDNDGLGTLLYIKTNFPATGPVVDMSTFVCDYNVYNPGTQPSTAFYAWSNTNKTFSQWQTLTGLDAHSTVGAVSFIDRAGNDFKLQGTDVLAKDKGADLSGVGILYDKIGTSRPQESAFDIGAYEYIGGGSSPTTTIWNGGTWSNSNPTSEVDAQINGHFTGEGFSCNDLTIAAGKQLSVTSGALSVGGALTLESDASSGPATIVDNGGTVSVSGTVTVKQNLTGTGGSTPSGRFWYVSSPVTGATSATFDAVGGNKLWSFSEANLETNVYTEITGNDAVLGVGNAYVARLGADTQVSFTGTALNTGDKSVSVTRTGTTHAKRGFNLVGNPYPSFVALNAGDNTNLNTSIWYRSMVTGGTGMAFDTYNLTSGAQTIASGSGALTGAIAPMQAVWVKVAADGAGGTVAFKNASRTHNSTVKLRNAKSSDIQQVRLQVSNGTLRDETLIGFYPEATEGEDDYDSPKLSNNLASMPEIFTKVEDEEMAINGLKATEAEKEVALGFRTQTAGAFTINATEILNIAEGKSVILKDKLLGNEQDLTVTPQYSFTSVVEENSDRFSVVIGRVPTSLQTSTQQFAVLNRGDGKLEIVFKGYESHEGAVCIMNALGQTVLSTTFNGEENAVDANLTPGIYFVNVSSKGFNATKKVIVNQ